MSDNQFANLPDGLTRGLIHLKYFSAFKNNLVHLRGGYFKDCVKLEGLYLNENLISNVDPDVFSEENFSAKASVDLSQNRLDVQTQIVLVSQLHSRIKL